MTRRGPRRPQDHFGHRARKEGYPARSVYKLQEIDRRLRLLRPGTRVLDLGAAPGSFARFAGERVGPNGFVLAVDRQPLAIALAGRSRFLELDVETDSIEPVVAAGPFDVVLSDMAPRTSGQRHRDQYRSFELYMRALEIAERALAPGGRFVAKIFQGAEFEEARAATRRLLRDVRILKPEASRRESYEIFIAGTRPAAP